MTSMKNTRNALLNLGLAGANSPLAEPSETRHEPAPERVVSGAVGAVSRTLDQFQLEIKSTHALIASGEHVIELPTSIIEASFLRDRLEVNAAGQGLLTRSIQQDGQQSPILVRPVAGNPGFYQIAYGHRRLAACVALGIKVKTLVRDLSDRELLVAQGQENSARRDLSFIERATFALKMEQRRMDRDGIMAALSTDKTEVSKLISVAASMPEHVIHAIGPAPKAGRPRWMALAERMRAPGAERKALTIVADPAFSMATSDERFVRLFDGLLARQKRGGTGERWIAADGTKVARIERSPKALSLTIDATAAPEFGDFVVGQLPQLYADFTAQRGKV